jgi:hypothetical protein
MFGDMATLAGLAGKETLQAKRSGLVTTDDGAFLGHARTFRRFGAHRVIGPS